MRTKLAADAASNRTLHWPGGKLGRKSCLGTAPFPAARSRIRSGSCSANSPNRTTMRIESKAPTRVDLAGSTLDIWPLYLFHPGAVTVNAAISRYASCVVDQHSQGDNRIKLVSRDTQRDESFASFEALLKGKKYQLPLLAEIVKFFRPEGGFTLTTDSEAPA